MSSKSFFVTAVVAVLALPLTQGCGSSIPGQSALCCSEFKVGGTITADIGGSAQSQVAVQAIADFSGIATAMIDDLGTACKGIAQDLDAPKADQAAAEAITDKRDRMNKWCTVAVAAIGTIDRKSTRLNSSHRL